MNYIFHPTIQSFIHLFTNSYKNWWHFPRTIIVVYFLQQIYVHVRTDKKSKSTYIIYTSYEIGMKNLLMVSLRIILCADVIKNLPQLYRFSVVFFNFFDWHHHYLVDGNTEGKRKEARNRNVWYNTIQYNTIQYLWIVKSTTALWGRVIYTG